MFNEIFKEKRPSPRIQQNTKIIVDNREKNSLVPSFLAKTKTPFEFKQLSIGDYLIKNTIVERKETRDFTQSIFNKRLFTQLKEIQKYPNFLLIIEGALKEDNVTKGTLLSIALKYKTPILFSKNAEETAHYLTVLANKKETSFNQTPKKYSLSTNEQIESVLTSFPNIGPKTAKKLLKKHKTIKTILAKSQKELQTEIGIKSNSFNLVNIPYTKNN